MSRTSAILASPQARPGCALTALLTAVSEFLPQVGQSHISPSAYDTAWVACLRDPSDPPQPRFPASLDWLRAHQHADGSWGAPWPYYHDRLLATLRAVLTLHGWGPLPSDRDRIEQGVGYIWRNADRLAHDPWETNGFELIFPALLAEATRRGIALPLDVFQELQQTGQAKLARIPAHLAYDQRSSPLTYNLEALITRFDPAHLSRLQDASGGVFGSPAATAVLLGQGDNAAAGRFLASALAHDGQSVPTIFSIGILEISWALYHLQMVLPDLYAPPAPATAALLHALRTTMTPAGWAFNHGISVADGDDTAVCFAILSQAGDRLDPQLLYQYEQADSFCAYPGERNPSSSVNLHMLDALRHCPADERTPRIAKILRFLTATQRPDGYWFDKWHVSPYYTTGHAVLALHDLAPDLVRPSIAWMLGTQEADGSWGFYSSTVEETAYVLLALLIWERAGHVVPTATLSAAAHYLQQHSSPDAQGYPPLWIGKTLYAPLHIIQSAVLAALLAYELR